MFLMSSLSGYDSSLTPETPTASSEMRPSESPMNITEPSDEIVPDAPK